MTDNTKYEVTRDEALSFCETAMRNWQYVAFSEDELDDLRVGLERFLSDRLTSQPAQSDLVEAMKDRLRGEVGEEWTDHGMEDAFFRWPVIERELRAALSTPTAPQPDRERDKYNLLAGMVADHIDREGATSTFIVRAGLLRDILANLSTHPTTDTQSGEYICKCGLRVEPHRCAPTDGGF